MKKKIIIIISTMALVTLIIFGYIYLFIESNPLKDVNADDIKEIFIADPSSNYIVTENEDINDILNALKDMKLYG